ncbi:MAG: hypothetical protein J6Y28_05645 [Acholeplasmatales bacterium]|nr:hypothetical protein [Acholeplasmatales bacterium]
MRLNDLDFSISDYVVKKTANYINLRNESFENLDDNYYNTLKDYVDTLATGEVYCVVGYDFPNSKMEKAYDNGEINDRQILRDNSVVKNYNCYRVKHLQDSYRGYYYPIFTNKDDLCRYIEELQGNEELEYYTILKRSIKDIYNEYVKGKIYGADELKVKGVVLNLYTDRIFLHGTLCRYIDSNLNKNIWNEYLFKVGHYKIEKKKKEEKHN